VPDTDNDNDGLSDDKEDEYKTEPYNPDTDDDGLYDGLKVYSTVPDPLLSDSNNNGIMYGDE